jgi:hypothetical protein
MKGDHLERARDAADGGAVTCALAHALIDIAESLRMAADRSPNPIERLQDICQKATQ